MTDIVCKCGASRLEDIQCAVCGEYFKAGWIPVSERLPKLKNYESPEINSCPEDMTVVIGRYADGEVFPAYVYYDGMYVGEFNHPAEELIYNETVFFADLRDDSRDNSCDITHWMPLPEPPEAE